MIEVRLLVHGAGRPNIESPDDKRIFVEVHIYWSPTSKVSDAKPSLANLCDIGDYRIRRFQQNLDDIQLSSVLHTQHD